MELRLGDVIDDYCIKCRRLTNHSVVSLMEGEVSKVRCRSCYHEHSYLHEQAPPSRKDLKKAELFNAVLAKTGAAEAGSEPEADQDLDSGSESPAATVPEQTEKRPGGSRIPES